MSTAIANTNTIDATIVERVLIHGDLRQLSPAQKISYYNAVCQSVGLNPLTRPFEYIVLNGKETFYAKRDATDQLRRVHGVGITIVAREVLDDTYIVTARATMPSGRQDESIGAVPLGILKGEARANAIMKCETKAKRRVTLSICGLGMLDETEVETIPGAVRPAETLSTPPARPLELPTQRHADNLPPPKSRGIISTVEDKQAASGKPYYVVTLDNGFTCVTWDSGLAKHAREAIGTMMECGCRPAKDPKYRQILEELLVAETAEVVMKSDSF